MLQLSSIISVRFTAEGWHRWEGAAGKREYLAHNHRHQFQVEASIDVRDPDREIEFHDFLDFCRANFPTGQLGGQSCEMLASGLIHQINAAYPGRREIKVSVFEDGEVGATVSYTAA